MGELLDMIVKANCKDDAEVEEIKKELKSFIRRIRYRRRKESEDYNYEISLVNLQNGIVKTIVNRRNPRE